MSDTLRGYQQHFSPRASEDSETAAKRNKIEDALLDIDDGGIDSGLTDYSIDRDDRADRADRADRTAPTAPVVAVVAAAVAVPAVMAAAACRWGSDTFILP